MWKVHSLWAKLSLINSKWKSLCLRQIAVACIEIVRLPKSDISNTDSDKLTLPDQIFPSKLIQLLLFALIVFWIFYLLIYPSNTVTGYLLLRTCSPLPFLSTLVIHFVFSFKREYIKNTVTYAATSCVGDVYCNEGHFFSHKMSLFWPITVAHDRCFLLLPGGSTSNMQRFSSNKASGDY